MMLSRSGGDRDPPLGRGQTGEGRRAPWGCAAGAPYRGTASPPPPPPVCVCVCVCGTTLFWFVMVPNVLECGCACGWG